MSSCCVLSWRWICKHGMLTIYLWIITFSSICYYSIKFEMLESAEGDVSTITKKQNCKYMLCHYNLG